MADFKTIWNAALDNNDLPDLIATVTKDSLSNLLTVHRNKKGDREFYRREEKFLDGTGNPLFTAEVIVGGDRAAHSAGAAKPLKIELVTVPIAPADIGFAYDYPPLIAGTAPEKPNAIITASDVNFYFSWPSSSSGTPWSTQLPGIEFTMEVFLRMTEIVAPDGQLRQALEVTPIRLRVSKASVALIKGHFATAQTTTLPTQSSANTELAAVPGDDQKVQDLFFALINYIALSVGPNLARVITFPIMQITEYEVLPNLFSISAQSITIGARLKASEAAERIGQQLIGFEQRFWHEVEADIYDQSQSAPLASFDDYEFPKAMAFAKAYRESLVSTRMRRMPSPPLGENPTDEGGSVVVYGADGSEAAAPDQQIGVGISEFLLDTIVSKFGNVHREGKTAPVSLILIRGRLGYELALGTIDIKVDPSGITGATPINVFGGIYYQLREVHGCSAAWGRERKLGLGVKGTPAIKLKTVPTSGLSILANFELGNLKFYTGAGSPIDDIVGKLSKPLMEAVEAVLDTIALGISFVVIPVKIGMPGQETAISMSKFVTSQYQHPNGGASSRNNYAMFVANTAAV